MGDFKIERTYILMFQKKNKDRIVLVNYWYHASTLLL